MIRLLKSLLMWLWWYPAARQETVIVWTRDDTKSLLSFMGSPAGKKLILHFRQNEVQLAMLACQDGSPIKCGFAQGYRASLHQIYQLSGIFAPQDEENNNPEESESAYPGLNRGRFN